MSRRTRLLRLVAHVHMHPSAVLLAVQLAGILLYPLAEDTSAGRAAIGVFGIAVLALSLWVVNRSPLANRLAWLLAIPGAALSITAAFADLPRLLPAVHLFEGALYLYAAGGLILYMLRDHRVTRDEWFAAGATFTLLAWAFAHAFAVCQLWYPGSFGEPRSWMQLLYTSFSILSGVGLSDIVPATPPARSLVMLEMFAGVAFIAVVVSRMVGLTMLGRRASKD